MICKKYYISNFLKITWLLSALCICGIVAFINANIWYNYVVCFSGIFFVVLNNFKLPISFIAGIIYSISYGILSFCNSIYGDCMFNFLYSLPVCIYGIIRWIRNANYKAFKQIQVKRMSILKSMTCIILPYVVSIAFFGSILKYFNDISPFLDAFTTCSQILGLILLVFGFCEAWIIFMLNNIASISLWYIAYRNNASNMPMMFMYLVYFLNSVIGLIYWRITANRK